MQRLIDHKPLRMELIYFMDPGGPCPDTKGLPGLEVRCHTDPGAYAAEEPPALGFVIALRDPEQAGRLLLDLRRNPVTALLPVFTAAPLKAPLDSVSDGEVGSPRQACERALVIAARLRDLDRATLESGGSDTLRILGYLYSRPERSLAPHRHWANEHYYGYPALEAMFGEGQTFDSRLSGMCERRLLSRGALVDRVRHCPECEGAHLSFVDVCQHCKSIDIIKKPFLHCFTCGKVAPEERFLEHGALLCPHCGTRLRHIGSDYDRPLENYECQACRHLFIEPDVLARCMHCDTLSAPDALIPRPVYIYELAERGAMAARSGMIEDLFALLDTVNFVSPVYFMNLVNWMMNLVRRHPEDRFTIIGVRFKNVLELNARLGRQAVADLMESMAGRLRELIRSTDMTTRTGQKMLWILLAKTGRPQHQVVLNRIMELKNLFTPVEGAGLDFETVVFCAPDDISPGETGKLLLARLEGIFH